jgi:hypothetical protein
VPLTPGPEEPTSRHPTPGTQSDVNSELVLTPGGWRPRSQVHSVESGHHISGKGGRLRKVETSTGEIVEDYGETSKDQHPRITPPKKKPDPSAPLTDTGWILNTGWSNLSGEPIAYFSTSWAVPSAPPADDNQVIFLFNGLEQSGDGSTPLGPYILQPVLQWGNSYAGGGNYWAITNWYVNGPGGTALYTSPLIQVNPGDVLQGVMTLTGQSGSDFSYKSSFIGYPGVDLTVTDIDELKWACETLECYGLSQCSDYPDAQLTVMYDIEIKTGSSVATSTDAAVAWQAVTNFADCGQNCVIVSNNSPGGAVNLYYGAMGAVQAPILALLLNKT